MQSAGIGGDQQIRRGVFPLALQALQEGIRLAGYQVDLYSRLFRKPVKQGFDEIFLARRVDVDFLLGC